LQVCAVFFDLSEPPRGRELEEEEKEPDPAIYPSTLPVLLSSERLRGRRGERRGRWE
jgi:hypothetical protein